MDFVKIVRQWFWRSSKFYAFCFCCGNSFRLSLANVGALVFCNKRQDLQNNIA